MPPPQHAHVPQHPSLRHLSGRKARRGCPQLSHLERSCILRVVCGSWLGWRTIQGLSEQLAFKLRLGSREVVRVQQSVRHSAACRIAAAQRHVVLLHWGPHGGRCVQLDHVVTPLLARIGWCAQAKAQRCARPTFYFSPSSAALADGDDSSDDDVDVMPPTKRQRNV
ncbi:hypothetical protein BCR44DRAFT_357715 [Catenaria anguillulae PL171]|uniref:Uncharacterized protein n=1 Tax=Catenaria anguillulae PL171 TaxID=765915 RepID=A0A1Y2HYF3_9FUNG|nr:hypothetical protein BCR44DRAFT_357715 [Catenaria anguillulae PL171]